MQLPFRFWILLILAACSSKPKVVQPYIPTGNEPEWIFAPMSGCDETFEICASGEAENFTNADLEARNSLASIFKVEIKSSLKSSTFSYLQNDYEKQEAIEQTYNSVDQKISEVLSTIEIKDRFQRGRTFFSLAKLDKSKVSQILKHEITTIDEELSVLAEQRKKSLLKQMVTLFEKRSSINEKLIVVRGQGIKAPIDQKFLEKLRFSKNKLIKKIRLSFQPDFPATIKTQLISLVSGLGHIIVESKEDLVIEMKWQVNEEHINVKGFVKNSFDLSIQTMHEKDIIGKIGKKVFVTGRTHSDTYVKAEAELMTEVENKLSQLNLD